MTFFRKFEVIEHFIYILLKFLPFCAFCFAAQVSSIPIVDDNDSLLDIYCRRSVDLTANVFMFLWLLIMLCLDSLIHGYVLWRCIYLLYVFYVLIVPYSDITALAKDRAYTHINLNEMTVHQVTAVTIIFLSTLSQKKSTSPYL